VSDIIDQIDALIDERLAAGEPAVGYSHGDPQYPKCPHCGRGWHGLKITERIEQMRESGVYDEAYSYADDTSPVLCEGSEFIGPMKSPPWQAPSYRPGVGLPALPTGWTPVVMGSSAPPRDPADSYVSVVTSDGLVYTDTAEDIVDDSPALYPAQYSIADIFGLLRQIWDERPDPMELFDRPREEGR
jgi:hypothetical protein